MKRTFILFGFLVLSMALCAAPDFISYQGRLTDSNGQPITSSVDVIFTFWDAETGGNQLGGFSDTDAITPQTGGLFSTMIGDVPGNPIPESIFLQDNVWLNINVNGVDLSPRTKMVSVGYSMQSSHADTSTTATKAINATSADHAVHADYADTATDANHATSADNALGLTGVLNNPGDKIQIGNDVWLQVAADGKIEIQANGQRYRLGTLKWMNPSTLSDNISPDGQNAVSPQVAMDNNGNAIIVWPQYNGTSWQIFKSEYRGGVWTYPSSLSDNISPDGQSAYDPQVAMDNNGNAIIVWYQSDGAKFQIFKSEYHGGVWTHPGLLSDNISPNGQNAENPQVAMDNNGNAIIVWQQSDGSYLQIFKSEYRGGVWTNPSSLINNISPNGQNAAYPQVAMDNNGNAIIVWFQSDGAKNQIFMSEYRSGAWTNPSSLSDNISPDGQDAADPQVAMNDNDNAIIVWYQYDKANWQIFKSEYRNGTWKHPTSLGTNISPDGQDAAGPQVAMDNNNNAIIVWYQYDGTYDRIFKSEYRSSAWKNPTSLSDNISPDGQSALYPQVAMDNNGNTIITWQQSDGLNWQICKSEFRSGAWTHPTSPSDNISPDGRDAEYPQVAMDNNGNAIIVWYQSDGSYSQIFKSEYRFGF